MLLTKEFKLLRQRSAPVLDVNCPKVADLAQQLWRFVEQNPCSGVSAIQFGIPQRVFISIVPPKLLNKVSIIGTHTSLVPGEVDHFGVFINPKIVDMQTEMVGIEVETCMSLPGVKCIVPRAIDIKVRYQTLKFPSMTSTVHHATLDNFFARVFQHEIDHLDGIVMTDRHLPKQQLEEMFKDSPQDLIELEKEMNEKD